MGISEYLCFQLSDASPSRHNPKAESYQKKIMRSLDDDVDYDDDDEDEDYEDDICDIDAAAAVDGGVVMMTVTTSVVNRSCTYTV